MSTPQTPHASHLDLDTQADLQEGLLDPQRATAVAAHLQDCAECRATRDALDTVRVQLRDRGAEDAATTAPEDVVRRLDDALAAASPPMATASATVVPITAAASRTRSPWRTHALQAAAVLVLIALVGGLGYGGIRALNDGGTTTATDSAAGGGAGTGAEKAAPEAGFTITSSGRDYTQASLKAAVPDLLAGTLAGGKPAPQLAPESPAAAGAVTSSAAPSTASPDRLREGPALTECVANLAGKPLAGKPPVTPLAVDVARFEGKPATVIVLPDPADKSLVNVYAVEPGCPKGLFLAWAHVALP